MSAAETRYDSRKYRLANRALIALHLTFGACLALLWRERQAELIPALFGGYATVLIGVLASYGLANVGAKWAGGPGQEPKP